MQMTDEIRIAAPREKVFAALNDPEILSRCIPGCESFDKVSENSYAAVVVAKVGPVRAKFNGQVTLSDIVPPKSYRISGEGKGGAAGFAKGGASVELEEDGAETVLKYDVKADVGGKLAQLGSRLIDGTAKSQAREFFTKFKDIVEGGAPEAEGVPAAEAAPAAAPAGMGRLAMWGLFGLIALIIIYMLVN